MAYWTDRQKQLRKQLERDEQLLNRKLKTQYEKELRRLEKDIASYYAAYGLEDVIEYRALMLELSDTDRKLLMERMDDFARAYPEHAHLMPVRASIYKLNRLEGLQQSIYMQQISIGAAERDIIKGHLGKVAERGYSAAAAMIGGTAFNVISTSAAKTLVNSKWLNGEDFSGRIWKNKAKLINYLQNDFKNAIIRGDSYDKAVKALRQRFMVGKSDAERLIFTEGTFMMNESAIMPFETMGYDTYIYAAIGDSKTCDICAAMDGEQFLIKDRNPGTNFPPMHANCRCSFEIAIEGDDSLTEREENHKGVK